MSKNTKSIIFVDCLSSTEDEILATSNFFAKRNEITLCFLLDIKKRSDYIRILVDKNIIFCSESNKFYEIKKILTTSHYDFFLINKAGNNYDNNFAQSLSSLDLNHDLLIFNLDNYGWFFNKHKNIHNYLINDFQKMCKENLIQLVHEIDFLAISPKIYFKVLEMQNINEFINKNNKFITEFFLTQTLVYFSKNLGILNKNSIQKNAFITAKYISDQIKEINDLQDVNIFEKIRNQWTLFFDKLSPKKYIYIANYTISFDLFLINSYFSYFINLKKPEKYAYICYKKILDIFEKEYLMWILNYTSFTINQIEQFKKNYKQFVIKEKFKKKFNVFLKLKKLQSLKLFKGLIYICLFPFFIFVDIIKIIKFFVSWITKKRTKTWK